MEIQANNQDKQKLIQNIANFKYFCFPDIRKLVFSLEQFGKHTLINSIGTFIFFSLPNPSGIRQLLMSEYYFHDTIFALKICSLYNSTSFQMWFY